LRIAARYSLARGRRASGEETFGVGHDELPDVATIDRLLASVLPPGSLYAVGGRVRDELRAELEGIPLVAKDLDYVVTGVGLDELVERLQQVGRTELVGASFAVVKCNVEGTTVDVALPRREQSTGAGHRDFSVESGASVPLEDDLARRDFRMNMMARRLPGGIIVDPFGGAADVAAHRIDLLKPAAFVEDPLRMLRACQFAARFEYRLSDATAAAMREAAPLVRTVSAERVRDELVKLLRAERPSIGFEAMRETGLLGFVLPELAEGIGVEQNEWHAHDVYVHTLRTLDAAPAGDLVVRLAALFHDIAKPRTKDGPHFYRHEIVGEDLARDILERLRFSNEESAEVSSLIRNHMYAADPGLSDGAVRRFVRRVGAGSLERQFALREADVQGSGLPKRSDGNERFAERVRALLALRPPLSVADLAISGNDVIEELIAAGLLPPGSRGGPLVGEFLRELLEDVTDEPSGNEREALLGKLRVAIRREKGSNP
jgi:tRNA nucleotidyltransferase (CCA-adding enzyme)